MFIPPTELLVSTLAVSLNLLNAFNEHYLLDSASQVVVIMMTVSGTWLSRVIWASLYPRHSRGDICEWHSSRRVILPSQGDHNRGVSWRQDFNVLQRMYHHFISFYRYLKTWKLFLKCVILNLILCRNIVKTCIFYFFLWKTNSSSSSSSSSRWMVGDGPPIGILITGRGGYGWLTGTTRPRSPVDVPLIWHDLPILSLGSPWVTCIGSRPLDEIHDF